MSIIILLIIVSIIIFFAHNDDSRYTRGQRFTGKLVDIHQNSKPIPRGIRPLRIPKEVIQTERPDPPPKKKIIK